MTPCTSCNTPTDNLALFPNNLCMNCYAVTEQGTRIVTAEELTRMWGGK